MSLQSDLSIDVAKLREDAIPKPLEDLNNSLSSAMQKGPVWYEVGAAKFREMRRNGETIFPAPTLLDSAESFSIPSRDRGRTIPCRILRPEPGRPDHGIYMHIHGGGWVLMSEKDQDPFLKVTADDANLIIISIGYRLAPEDPFPRGPEDCYDAAEWLVDNAQAEFGVPLKFAGGESAGAHLTMLTTFHLVKSRPKFQFNGLGLYFGAYDLSLLPLARNFPRPLILNADAIAHFLNAFLPNHTPDERKDPSISPFYQSLHGLKLPPALFICGTEDCLLEDSVMMALRYQMSGNPAILKLFTGCPHGFNVFGPATMPAAKECREITKQFLLENVG